MNWTNFLFVIFIVYLIYYSLNLLFDLFLSPKLPSGEAAEDELFFSQTFSPELITPEKKEGETEKNNGSPAGQKHNGVLPSGPITSSGGIGLKQLFLLAKDNLIEHTRAIPY